MPLGTAKIMHGRICSARAGHLLDAEIVLLQLDTASTGPIPATFNFGEAAKVAGAEEVVLKRAAAHALEVLGRDQFPFFRVHATATG